MGHAAGKPTDGLHLLSLAKLALEAAAPLGGQHLLGDVIAHAEHGRLAVVEHANAAQGRCAGFSPSGRIMRRRNGRACMSVRQHGAHADREDTVVVRGDHIVDAATLEAGGRQATDAVRHRVGERDAAHRSSSRMPLGDASTRVR